MFKVGDKVNFHSIIGGPVTSQGHEITYIDLQPNNFGCDVAWITGKSGCVAMAALSNVAHPMKSPEKPLTRSQERYRSFIDSEYPDSFAYYIGIFARYEFAGYPGRYRFVNKGNGITGPWAKTKKEAKAGYKALLKERRTINRSSIASKS